ncbi:MAG: hypothetical protein K5668_00500 [Lachnospiraceae bacterium]|nr:hypothetical protein [Lachnospiraceae bacterium]
MAVLQEISSFDQLTPFLNKEGILEIVMRDEKKKYKAFQKLVINNAPDTEVKELLNKAVSAMNRNAVLSEKNYQMLGNVAMLQQQNLALSEKGLQLMMNAARLQQLSLVFGALNLSATCAGFAIMYAKLDKMSGQINQVMGTVKQGQDIAANYEFHKVLSEHSNMLDCRKTQKYYTEEQMRQLVDDEYNILKMLIEAFLKDHTDDRENLIVSIYSMASMLAVSLRYFDELYYINNREAIGDGDVWHAMHDNWTAVFENLLSDEFVEKIQDHGVFDLGLTTFETDAYYITLCDQVREMKETVEDNQKLVMELGSEELMAAYEAYVNQEVAGSIQEALTQTEGAMEAPEVMEVCQNAMKQMALAV